MNSFLLVSSKKGVVFNSLILLGNTVLFSSPIATISNSWPEAFLLIAFNPVFNFSLTFSLGVL